MGNAPVFGLPYVNVWLGKTNLAVPPNSIVSFTYTETMANKANVFELVLFDTSSGDVIFDFARRLHNDTLGDIKFNWGWPGRMSEERYGSVSLLVPGEVDMAGIGVTVQGMDSGAIQGQTKGVDTYEGSPSDVVKEVAKKHGWKVDMEEAQELYEFNEKEDKKAVKKYSQGGMSDLEFINALASEAKSKETGEVGFKVYFDGKSKEPTLNFHPVRAHRNPLYRRYLVGRERDGVVLEFSPEIADSLFMALGGDTMVAHFTAADTYEPVEKKVAIDSWDRGSPSQGKYRPDINKGKTTTYVSVPTGTVEHVGSRVDCMYNELSAQIEKATLTVVGDPYLRVDANIEIIVLTNTGVRFFTSGIYHVYEIEHKILGGDYTSVLQLEKSGRDEGRDTFTKSLPPEKKKPVKKK